MVFRYFDASGRQVSLEELRELRVTTPAMEHVFATVAQRLERPEGQVAMEQRRGKEV